MNKDAKYTVLARAEGSTIRLVYRESYEEQWLLTTQDHARLAEMVNRVKQDMSGAIGGAFYINEYQHVIVPIGKHRTQTGHAAECYFAGTYRPLLEFPYHGNVLSAAAPNGLKPRDEWPGPHVGVPYILEAGGKDVRYEAPDARDPDLLRRFRLSKYVGAGYAARLAGRLAEAKGAAGGRLYINEARNFFAPVERRDSWIYIYLGTLGDDPWFPEPKAE